MGRWILFAEGLGLESGAVALASSMVSAGDSAPGLISLENFGFQARKAVLG